MLAFTVAKRVIKEIIGDKRSLALLVVAPIFVVFLLNIILTSSVSSPKLGGVNLPNDLQNSLSNNSEFEEISSEENGLSLVKDGSIDGLLVLKDNALYVTIDGSDSTLNNIVKKTLMTALGEYTKTSFSSNSVLSKLNIQPLESNFIYLNGNEDMNTFDNVAPMMMGFFIFFFVFLIAGIAFLRERISGTLDRLLATPIKRLEIVLGYFLGFGVFVVIQTIVIQIFMIYGLNMTIKGSNFLVLLINLLLAAGSLALGTLLSSFAKNEFQLFQFIPVVIVPQILFSGLFNLREAPTWVIMLSKIFPLTYGADALKSVVIKGSSFYDIGIDLLVLLFYTILFITLNSLALKKYRKL